MRFRVTGVQEQRLENGNVVTLVDLDYGYQEFLELEKALPRPPVEVTRRKLCSLFARVTRPNAASTDMVASVVTTDPVLSNAVLGFYRRRADEIPIGSEIELLGYELSPI